MTDLVDEREVDELALDVTSAAGRLAGSAEAAAVLESMGTGDERARRLGQSNVFRLAAEVAERQERSPEAIRVRREVEQERRAGRLAHHEAGAARRAARSAALAVPLLAPAVAIPVLTGSLWGGGPSQIERATAIALAVAASFTAVAGFVLAAAAVGRGRRTGAVARETMRVIGLGLVAAVVAGLGLWAALSWKDFVAPPEAGITLQYFALLAALWLATGLAVAAGRTGWVSIALAAGTAVAIALRLGAGSSQLAAQRAGILVAAALAAGAAWMAARNGHRRIRVPASPPATVVSLVLLGTAVGGMLFADRVASWYSQSPFHFWVLGFRPDIEAGWDWAALAVFGAVAVAVSAACRFGSTVAAVAERTPLTAHRAMADEVRTMYRRSVGRMMLAALVGGAVTFVAMLTAMALSSAFADVVSRNTTYVFAIVGPGLVLLVWAAFNASILMGMGRRTTAVLAAAFGLLVDAAVALPLAAHAEAWAASVGLAAGALVFLAGTFPGVRGVLRNPDLVFATRG